MSNTIPLFTSHYSIGCSCLSLDKPDEVEENGPQSIIKLCVDNKIEKLYLVENTLSGFIKAYKNSKDNDLKLRFGLKMVVCNDMNEKSPESLKTEHKVIVMASNSAGYKRLRKIYSEASTHGFYYRPRIDSDTLKKFWDKKDLMLVHPFYYSFLHRNHLYFANCQPNYNFADNFFFVEKNDLPFNYLIENAIKKFTNGKAEIIPTQTIYYTKPEDFKTYIVYKSIHNRETLDKPNMDHFASAEFNLEHWKELKGKQHD